MEREARGLPRNESTSPEALQLDKNREWREEFCAGQESWRTVSGPANLRKLVSRGGVRISSASGVIIELGGLRKIDARKSITWAAVSLPQEFEGRVPLPTQFKTPAIVYLHHIIEVGTSLRLPLLDADGERLAVLHTGVVDAVSVLPYAAGQYERERPQTTDMYQ